MVQSDPISLLWALNWCIGTFFALRGGKEHKAMRRDSFVVGRYDSNHPLSGYEYLELKDMNLITKVNSIRFGNTAAVQRSDNGDSLRFLIMEGDYSNVGFVYKQLVSQLPLTTQHIYVYPLKASSILSHMKDGLTCRFSINVIGINPLSQFIKKLCHAAGVEDWKSKTPHMMRAFVCTTLANDSSVNSNEVARTLRHKSIASQQAYIGMTTQSEMSRNTAILGKSTMDALVANKPIEEEDRKLTVEEMQALNATDTKTAAISVDEERKKKRKKKKKKQKKKIR